jgi:hypothetical protein
MREATTRAHARRSRIKRELTEEWARRRTQRRLPDCANGKIADRVFKLNERWKRGDGAFCADEVELGRQQLQVRLLFARLPLVDDFTERTWMRTVECFHDRLTKRTVFGVIDDHCSPCNRLEREPLQTDCAAKRKNCDRANSTVNHARKASDALAMRQFWIATFPRFDTSGEGQ